METHKYLEPFTKYDLTGIGKDEGKVSPGFCPPIPDSLQEPKDTSQLWPALWDNYKRPWKHHQSNHSAGTLIPCSYLTISAFAENAEMVAVENNIDVGNVPIKFHLCLWLILIDLSTIYIIYHVLLKNTEFYSSRVHKKKLAKIDRFSMNFITWTVFPTSFKYFTRYGHMSI